MDIIAPENIDHVRLVLSMNQQYDVIDRFFGSGKNDKNHTGYFTFDIDANLEYENKMMRGFVKVGNEYYGSIFAPDLRNEVTICFGPHSIYITPHQYSRLVKCEKLILSKYIGWYENYVIYDGERMNMGSFFRKFRDLK